jgi:hypothetical protein
MNSSTATIDTRMNAETMKLDIVETRNLNQLNLNEDIIALLTLIIESEKLNCELLNSLCL